MQRKCDASRSWLRDHAETYIQHITYNQSKKNWQTSKNFKQRRKKVVPLLHLCFEKVILATMQKNRLSVVKKINRRVPLGDIFNGTKQQNSEVKNMNNR